MIQGVTFVGASMSTIHHTKVAHLVTTSSSANPLGWISNMNNAVVFLAGDGQASRVIEAAV